MSVAAGTRLFACGRGSAAAKGRSCRVIGLLVAVVLMSLGDLYITLMYLTSVGMSEGNPLARWVMGYNNPGLLIAWKLATVGAACWILYAMRRSRTAEIGAWFCCLLLVWLTVRWITYTREVAQLTEALPTLTQAAPDRWVQMTP